MEERVIGKMAEASGHAPQPAHVRRSIRLPTGGGSRVRFGFLWSARVSKTTRFSDAEVHYLMRVASKYGGQASPYTRS